MSTEKTQTCNDLYDYIDLEYSLKTCADMAKSLKLDVLRVRMMDVYVVDAEGRSMTFNRTAPRREER